MAFLIAAIIFNSIILTLSFLSFFISFAILLIVSIRVRSFLSNVPIILTCNNYLTLLLGSLMMFITYSYSLYGDNNDFISFDDRWCQLRSYLMHVSICAFYYSCALQAAFRLFRVVFYKNKQLQSPILFSIAIIIQWIFSFLYELLHLLLNEFEYSSEAYGCWISFKNIRGLLTAFVLMYCIPLFFVCSTYIYIIRHIRQTNHIQQRLNRNKRDLLILKRIVIIVLIAVGLGLPTGFMLIISIITNYVTYLAFHIQGLSISGGFIMGSIAFAFTTPQIREVLKIRRRQQINPRQAMIVNNT